jgi:hypothetical protein
MQIGKPLEIIECEPSIEPVPSTLPAPQFEPSECPVVPAAPERETVPA